ncbi:MAG: hypothetical protein LBH22_04810 [Bacteroidales bacterium]|jgi:hypothetical protein|nr:hypothetical protein [Bacteroidales bacterium]
MKKRETWRIIQTRFGHVQISNLHGKNEMVENIRIACFLADKLGHSIVLLARSTNLKCADSKNVTLDILQEYKISKTSTQSSIDNVLRKAAKQANHIVLEIQSKISDGDLRNYIHDRVARTLNIESVIIIRNNTFHYYFREQILQIGWSL